MAIRYAPITTTTGKPATAPTSSPAALDAFNRAMAEIQRPATEKIPAKKPKAQASQPIEPSGRGRKPAEDPREKLSIRLPASLIRELDTQHPTWKAQIETLLRTHFKPNQF